VLFLNGYWPQNNRLRRRPPAGPPLARQRPPVAFPRSGNTEDIVHVSCAEAVDSGSVASIVHVDILSIPAQHGGASSLRGGANDPVMTCRSILILS
jgi:hypothetical protein